MALINYDATIDSGGKSLLDTLRGYRSVPHSAISLLGSSRCFGCCPELELANGRRVISRRGSPTVRVDDVQVHETRDSQVR